VARKKRKTVFFFVVCELRKVKMKNSVHLPPVLVYQQQQS